MANLNNIIKAVFLFLCLITFINSKDTEWIRYNPSTYSGKYEHTTGEKTQSVALEFSNEREKPLYVKVTITPNEDTPTPLLCFSQEGASCNVNREILYKKTDGTAASIYVKKEQFDSGDLYILVTCEATGCGYTLTFEGSQVAEIDANSVFSYLVSSYNREMRFSAIGEAEEGSFLTIGVEGSSNVQINIDDDNGYEQYKLDAGRIVTFPIVNSNSNVLATFTIKGANTGEFLTLNVHVVFNARAKDNLLYPNGPVVMGLLSNQEGYFREECFPISAFATGKYSTVNKYFLTGRIHSKYGLFWLADEKDMYMEVTDTEISDGLLSFMIETNGLKRSVCFEFSYEDDVKMNYVAYSLSLIEVTKMENIYNFYPPFTLGQTYRKMIPKGKYAVYHPASIVKSDKRLNYYMYNRKGVAEMYTYECLSYPDCTYAIETIPKFNHPKRTSKMTLYDYIIDKDYNSLDQDKQVMIVYCKDDDNENNGYCEVDVSFNTPGKNILLIEDEQLSKYALKGEKGTFKIDFKGGVRIQILIIDIMIYSGDVTFTVKGYDKLTNGQLKDEAIDISYYKYYLSNKIVFYFNFAQLTFESVELEYTPVVNSFFTIKYSINKSNFIQLEENILSGESYLVEIDPTTSEKNKTVYLPNYRTKRENPFLANFFQLNCDFEVTRNGKEIAFSDGYAQEILSKTSQGYNSEKYQYDIKVLEADLSNYNHKMCMLYVAGYESSDDDSVTEIVVGENINQQVIFNNDFKTIRFLYPLADSSKELAVYVNIIDQAYYNVKIYSNSNNYSFKQYTITRSQIFYLSESDLINQCNRDTLCNIIVEAQFTKNITGMSKTSEPMIEITIRQIQNTPTYLQKSQAKRDFTCGDSFYYLYTDIGKNEIGEVSVNFLRDFGNVWGKVVRKDQTEIEQEANWRGIYRMPSADWGDSLPFNGYTKKFEIGIEDTQDCIEGCYLLLSIQISQIGDYVEEYKFYPFSIITRITPNNYAFTDIPKVVIQVNEYIIGNVDVSKNERIYQFYEVWLPHDSYRVDFDFQSEVAGLYINVGGTRPTTKNADFVLLPPGRDSILSIDKFQIMQVAEKKRIIKDKEKGTLEDINLVIGVWTDKTDSIDTEVFSLSVRLPNDDITIDIIEVNTDQKILCKPQFFDTNQYRCLFMITYDDQDVELNMPLLIHAASVNQSSLTYVYGSYIERKYYDEYDVEQLRTNTPTSQTAKYSTQRSGLGYIYTKIKDDGGDTSNYFFVNVVSDNKDEIFILTSMPMYNDIAATTDQFYPNPTTEQLLSVSKDKLRLKFFTTSSLIVNFVTLGGEGEISWADDLNTVFNLRGGGDRLSMTSGKTSDEIIITKRKTQNEEDSGFFFYISYYIRDLENNFDEVQFGQSVELSYRETDLPVFLYSKLNSYFNDMYISVTFTDSEIDTGGEYSESPMVVKAALAKESTVYKAKKNPDLSPTLDRSIAGAYDPALRTAIVYIPNEKIKEFNIKAEDNPTLYLSLAKNENVPEQKYEKFNVEAQFSKINGAIIPAEKSYNYGRHTNYYTNYYRLRKDKNKSFMIIEMAFNSKYLDFSVNIAITRYNSSDLIVNTTSSGGKTLILVNTKRGDSNFIYLNIFRKVDNKDYPMLYNYVFKYINIEKEDEFQDFKIKENNGKLEIKEKTNEDGTTTIDCTFNPIYLEDKSKANITYFFKVVENSTHYYGEEYNTIAVMESPYHTVYKRNPEENNGKITLSATGDLSNWCYLQVIAQIQQDTFLEYVAYNGIKNIRDAPKGSESSSGGISTTVFVVVAVILLSLIAGLVVVVFIFQQRNKSLMNQVKHVSFQQNAGAVNTSSTDPELLLQKNQSPQ